MSLINDPSFLDRDLGSTNGAILTFSGENPQIAALSCEGTIQVIYTGAGGQRVVDEYTDLDRQVVSVTTAAGSPIGIIGSVTELKIADTLSAIDLRALRSIEYLDLSGQTTLTGINLFGCRKLEYLDMSGCSSLSILDLKENVELQTLILSGCSSLLSLKLDNNTKLQTVDLTDCSALSYLDATMLTELQTLTLDGTQLESPNNTLILVKSVTSKDSSAIKRINERITSFGISPKDFGAVGDGISDDTDALRSCIKYASDNKCRIIIGLGEKYYVTGAINYYNGSYNDVTLDIVGCIPDKRGEYSISGYGGIIVKRGTSLFENKTIRGSICNVSVVGARDIDTNFFKKCSLSGLVVARCNITNFGAFLCDSGMSTVSMIHDNTFLTVFYFERAVEKNCSMVDSFIYNNYINGGAEPVDNSCFEFYNYNGSSIHDNFIDYYRTIYHPSSSTQATVGHINSHSNHYQVFRYFYIVGGRSQTMTLNSVNDFINWTDPPQLEKLRTYTPIKYTGRDGNAYDIPPFIFGNIGDTACINIDNITIENNVGSLIFFRGSTNSYAVAKARFYVSNMSEDMGKHGINLAEGGAGCYNNGQFRSSVFDTNFAFLVSSLPTVAAGWSNYWIGTKVILNHEIYVSKRSETQIIWEKES